MFHDFVNRAIAQDSRNLFEKYSGDLTFVPDVFRDFYSEFNPKDVEVLIDGGYVCFKPVDELIDFQLEYGLGNECFVFASCNGEPIYMKDNKIYTCLFGKNGIKETLLADDIFTYLNKLDD